jgi:hypothetical protein
MGVSLELLDELIAEVQLSEKVGNKATVKD